MKVELMLFDKKLKHHIIPWNSGDNTYDDIDITYADGNWYITGGEKITKERYELSIIIKDILE